MQKRGRWSTTPPDGKLHSTYLVCDGSSIIVMIIRVLLNIWYLVYYCSK